MQSAAGRFKLMAAVVEHGRFGWLACAIAEWRASQDISCPLLSFGTPDEFMHEVGSQAYARDKYGIVGEKIAKDITSRLLKV